MEIERDQLRRVDPDAPAARRNGFGLASVRNRMYARYGSAARLDVRVNQDRFQVMLSLPYDSSGEVPQA